MRFYIGTTNRGKIREIGAILTATGCDFIPTDPIEPEETEPDFEGNAKLKAIAYAKHSGGITISEDSGLVIPSLRGLPGPWSARFSEYNQVDLVDGVVKDYVRTNAPTEVIDKANCELVLDLMEDIEQPRRSAYFKVVLVVATPEEVLFTASGESHGWIAEEMRGDNGFGYDPIFIGEDTFNKTYAELDSFRKNLRSHRTKVLEKFTAWLGKHLRNGK